MNPGTLIGTFICAALLAWQMSRHPAEKVNNPVIEASEPALPVPAGVPGPRP